VRCKNCHYALEGLTVHRCPECGRVFDPCDHKTFDDSEPLSLEDGTGLVILAIMVVAVVVVSWFGMNLRWFT
jgi:hypothetical protein